MPETGATGEAMTVSQAAQHFRVDPATVRRWIAAGCPCARKGSRGPGCGAILNLDEVNAWRRRSEASEPDLAQTLGHIATALWQSLHEDRADIRAGISREDAAAVLIIAWNRVCKAFGASYPFDRQPDGIRALMREL